MSYSEFGALTVEAERIQGLAEMLREQSRSIAYHGPGADEYNVNARFELNNAITHLRRAARHFNFAEVCAFRREDHA